MLDRADELLALAEQIVEARKSLAALVARHHALVAEIAGVPRSVVLDVSTPPAAPGIKPRIRLRGGKRAADAPKVAGANTGQQAAIVDFLARSTKALTPAEIAAGTGFPERSVYFGLVGGKRRRKLFATPERNRWKLTDAGRADHAKRHTGEAVAAE